MPNNGATPSIEKLEGQVDDLLKQLDDVVTKMGGGGGPGPNSEGAGATGSAKDNAGGFKKRPLKTVNKAAEDTEEDPDMVKARLEQEWEEFQAFRKAKGKKAEAAADEEDDMDEDDMGKAAEMIEKGDDETLTINGTTIYKSAVGENQFAIFKSLNADLAKTQDRLQKAQDETELATLRKRADDDYPFVPGSTDERALMLKAMNGMPAAVRKSFESVFIASNKLAKAGFDRVGVHGRDPEDMQKTAATFEGKVSEIKKRDGCTNTEAMQKARAEDPEGFKAYQGKSS